MMWEKYYHLVQQPRTLESLAMKRLGDWVALRAEKILSPVSRLQHRYPNKANDLLSREIEMVRNHLERKLPGQFHNKLVVEVMRALSELSKTNYRVHQLRDTPHRGVDEQRIIGSMIETLFTRNLTSLSIEYYDTAELFQNSLYYKSYRLTEIIHLNWIECTLNETDVIQILTELNSLKHLKLHKVGTDNIVISLVENCKLIENLDLYESEISDKSIHALVHLRNLTSVNLCRTPVTKESIATLLMFCDNIEYIDTDIEIAQVLQHIDSVKAGKQFKLKSYTNHSVLTLRDVQFVTKMCPLIQNVDLIQFKSSPEKYLMALSKLRKLRELKLRMFNFYADKVKELLKIIGCNLVHLNLKYICEVHKIELKHICVMCPNLQSLSMSYCGANHTFIAESHDLTSKIQIQPLRHLKRVTLINIYNFDLNKHLLSLISNCPNVEHVSINRIGVYPLTAQIFLNALEKNPKTLMNLKELIVYIRGDDAAFKLMSNLIVQNSINSPKIGYYKKQPRDNSPP